MASVAPRSLAIATQVLLMPLAINRLGADGYAVWLLATAIPSVLVTPDLGLGQGVVNNLVNVYTRTGHLRDAMPQMLEIEWLLRRIAAAWVVMGTMAIAAYVMAGAPAIRGELFTALLLSLIIFSGAIPATIWTRAQLATKRAHEFPIREAWGRLAALLLCCVVLLLNPNVPLLVVAFMLPNTAAVWVNALAVRKPLLPPSQTGPLRLRAVISNQKSAMRLGGLFVVMQLAYLASTASDPYLINALTQPGEVAHWAVAKRPFDLLTVAAAIYATALWPIYRQRALEGDTTGARRIFLVTASAAFVIVAVGGVLLASFRNPVFRLLSDGIYVPSTMDLISLAVIAFCTAFGTLVSVLLNATERVKAQAIILSASAILTLAIKVIFLQASGLQYFFPASAAGILITSALPLSCIAIVALRSIQKPRDSK